MKSYFALLISLCLLTIPLYPRVSVAQDVHSQAVSVGQGVERLWSDIPRTMNVLKEESKVPKGYEVDLTVLQTLKNQPFKQVDNLPFTEVDGAASLFEPQSLAPTILRDFEGLDDLNQPDGYLHKPPDPILAVGFNHVGVMVNSEFAFYTKDGTLVEETDFSSWWSDVYSGTAIPFDPRMAYDHHADRWLMMALVKDDPDSWYLLSVSQTSDPTGAWWNYRLDGTLAYGGATWADYPDLGFDGIADGAIYITSNQFTFAADIFRTAMLNILPKSALYSGSGFSYWRAWGRTNEDGSQAFTLRAAHTFGNPSGEFLINSKSRGWDKVTLWRVNPTFPPDPVDWVRQATITIGSYSPPPDAQQMGGGATLDTIDNRIYNCMYRNGYLYAAFTEAYDWGSGTVAAIRYLKIDTSTNGADLNVRYGADGYYYWFPAIYADRSDNIVTVFARSSSTEYAGIRYTGRKTTDTATQPSALLKAGETYITGYRWGDYFGISDDPSDGSKIWIYGEWAKDCLGVSSDWDWGTWIGEVSFGSEPITIIVPDDYPTIQQAVDAAISGDTIYVRAGTYPENVVVGKTVSLIGEDRNTTIIDGSGSGYVVQVLASYVTIRGFTIRNGGSGWGSGVGITGQASNITNNVITNNSIGIYVSWSYDAIISGNNITANGEYGIFIDGELINDRIYENHIEDSNYGIYFDGRYESYDNIFFRNNITGSSAVGIMIRYADEASYDNTFYHNNFENNSMHAYDDVGDNIWDNGYPSGGNYWEGYTDVDNYSGPYQNETGSDGIWDNPYDLPPYVGYQWGPKDHYPLTSPYGGPNDIGITNITTSKTVAGQGYNLNITLKIINYGINTETFNLTAYANTTTIQAITNVVLTSRNSTTLTFTWNTTDVAYGNYTISAVADTVTGETDTADNTLTDGWVIVTIIGDVNGDGIVDASDLFDVSKAYGSDPSKPNWNPNAEINNDGKVDGSDLLDLSKNYGKTAP